jgi:3-methylcrotonyl-CoA carboxylase alpha subunit
MRGMEVRTRRVMSRCSNPGKDSIAARIDNWAAPADNRVVFGSLLIANRGEIARRIIRTARRMGIRTVAVFTEADRSWPHWREADAAVLIGEGPAPESYLSIERIIAAAGESGAEAVHPGYGFLSENATFAEAVTAAGLIFVGPPADAIRAMGSKSEAKSLMALAGVPVVPGYSGERQEPYFLKQKAYELGYPVMIKAVSGGGGRGMRRVARALDFDDALQSAKREAISAFGDSQMLIERYIESPRHIEVQVFADEHGNVVHLFERDCSVQRRHQQVIEEAPAPDLSDEMRAELGAAAVKAATAVGYRGAGTVEFVADASTELSADGVFFIEMNTRLQVEHPVTEAVTGLDLVEWQLRVAAGEPLPLTQDQIALRGHAIEARLYAEDPGAEFRPSTGPLVAMSYPSGIGIRVDAGAEQGSVVSPHYDAMLGKVITHGLTREEALVRLAGALGRTRIAGPKTNLAFLSAILAAPEFQAGGVDTGFIDQRVGDLVGDQPPHGLAARAITEWIAHEADAAALQSAGPWTRLDSFELMGLRRKSSLGLLIEGEPAVAAIEWSARGPIVVSIGENPPEYQREQEIIWSDNEAFVLNGGRQLRVGFPDPSAREGEDGRASGQIMAPMHGRIIAVAVAPGTRVEKGDPLFSLEAMKMEHGVVAPLAGLVQAVRIVAGRQVEEGVLAVVIQPDPVD